MLAMDSKETCHPDMSRSSVAASMAVFALYVQFLCDIVLCISDRGEVVSQG